MAEPELVIRRATLADLEALTAARIALFTELGELPEGFATNTFATACSIQLGSMMSSAGASAWLAFSPDGAACASAILLDYPRLPSPRNPRTREGYSMNVYVAPAWRRRGIASALIAGALTEAKQRGLARVRLHTTLAGREVYRAHGFQPRNDEMEWVL